MLKNNSGEYLKILDTANQTIEFTTDKTQAVIYDGKPGGGEWSAENQALFIKHYFQDEYKERVETLHCVYE